MNGAPTTAEAPLTPTPPKAIGRPSKLTPRMVENIYFLSEKGLTDAELCKVLGINVDTLSQWKTSKTFSATLKKCKALIDDQVENALLRRALGYEVEEVVYEKSKTGGLSIKMAKKPTGELEVKDVGHSESHIVRITKKQVLPDVTAQIFWLKNRRKEAWRDKELEGPKGDTHWHLTFNSPKPSVEEAAKEINRISQLTL